MDAQLWKQHSREYYLQVTKPEHRAWIITHNTIWGTSKFHIKLVMNISITGRVTEQIHLTQSPPSFDAPFEKQQNTAITQWLSSSFKVCGLIWTINTEAATFFAMTFNCCDKKPKKKTLNVPLTAQALHSGPKCNPTLYIMRSFQCTALMYKSKFFYQVCW